MCSSDLTAGETPLSCEFRVTQPAAILISVGANDVLSGTDINAFRASLTQAIEAVTPWRTAFRVVKQPFEGEFSIVEAPDSFAEHFRCEGRSREAQVRALSEGNLRYGTYYGAVFRFRRGTSRGGVLALLWTKQGGAWRVIAWEVIAP